MWGEEEGGGIALIPERGGIAAGKGGTGREGATLSQWHHHLAEVLTCLYIQQGLLPSGESRAQRP